MTRPDPLDRFAPWPPAADAATADALIRHAVVHAAGALALVEAGHDTARQTVRAVKYVAIASLLTEVSADPALADEAARRLWARLGDGADIQVSVHAWAAALGIDADEAARTAVHAFEARAAAALDTSARPGAVAE